METAIATPRPLRTPSSKRRSKAPEHLFSREEAKDLLGEYAFSLIDEARNNDAELEAVLDRLDDEGVDTETFEDAAFGRMMDEGFNSEFISEEEFFSFLRSKSRRVSREKVMKTLTRL